MNGTAALIQLLLADAGVLALVPAARIVVGVHPQGTALPAIALAPVSGNDLQFDDPHPSRFVTERIQATVLAKTWPELAAVLAAVKSAGDAQAPVVTGISNVVVRTDGQGPWFIDDQAAIHLQSQDFRVSYSKAA
jgi:Protein of unknown function (DUF3168)